MMYEPTGYCWACGIVINDGEVFCPKHKHTKPKPEKRGHWSGYSKFLKEIGGFQGRTKDETET